MACQGCCWSPGYINQANARFLLLGVFIIIYMLCGAAVFSAMERGLECKVKDQWKETFRNFSQTHNLDVEELRNFLRAFEEALSAGVGVEERRPRWDFPGAFYFVATVVATIGFGMTAPSTPEGRLFLIFYGLIGCAGTILFFNLFLERLITVIAYIMKSFHEKQIRKKIQESDNQKSSGTLEADSMMGWKPSVYYVVLIMGIATFIVFCCASAMYTPIEGWSYLDSFYFCFVAFSTIGFGDLVSSQNAYYDSQDLYRFANFMFILLGVCCLYSLFSVVAILIKQVINWILKKIARLFCNCQRKTLVLQRNVVTPSIVRSGQEMSIETDGVVVSEPDGRCPSGEMISAKDFLASNKVSSAILQKQLSETANGYPPQDNVSVPHLSEEVGRLAIIKKMLAETSEDG